MYDFVGRNKRIVQVLLALLVVPFALVGVDSYLKSDANDQTVARVGKESVTRAEYDNAMREQTDRLRQMLGRSFDPSMFDNNEVRGQVLDGLVSQRLLKVKGQALNLTAGNAQLQKVIGEIPQFQENGKFSGKRYEEVLRAQGMSPPMFEQRLRQDLSLQPLQDSLAGSHFVSAAQTQKWLQINEQQREVSVLQLTNQSFQPQVVVDDATAKAHYEKTPANYQAPEQVKIEYLLLSQTAIAAQQSIDAAEVKATYEKRGKEFATSEERQASHILIGLSKDGKEVKREDAKKKADEIFAAVKADPSKFAEFAKTSSDDPGSKDQGGDLGFFGRGAMVKPFEDAVFSMAKDEIKGPVASDFGFHIIKLVGTKGGAVPPFDEVKSKIEQDLRNQKAQARFAELAQKFQDKVFEQSDSFKDIAEETKVPAVTSPWMTRSQVQAVGLGNAKLVQSVFSPSTIASKKNTEAVEIAPNTLMAARVIEHRPAATRPFDEVKNDVLLELKRKGATEIAKKVGAEKLELLQAGKDAGVGVWPAVAALTRAQRIPGVSDEMAKAIFNAPAEKLPMVVGATNEQGGYSFVRITKIVDASSDDAKVRSAAQRLNSTSAADLTTAYIASLKTIFKTETNVALVEKKSDDPTAAPTKGNAKAGDAPK